MTDTNLQIETPGDDALVVLQAKDQLTTDARSKLQHLLDGIHDDFSAGIELVRRIGHRASDARKIIEQAGLSCRGRSSVWGAFLRHTFQQSGKTVERFRLFVEAFPNLDAATAANLNLTAGYVLAVPSVPIAARAEAIALAQSGTKVTREIAREIVLKFSQPNRGNEGKSSADISPVCTANSLVVLGSDEVNGHSTETSQPPTELIVPRPNNRVSPSTARSSGSKSHEWPPKWLVDRALEFFGGHISTDPATNDKLKPNVPAQHLYDAHDDGIQFVWHSTVWLNPPFSKLYEFTDALITHFEAGEVTEALMVGPTYPSSSWFRMLVEAPRCHFEKRVAYESPFDSTKNSPNVDTTLFYLGPQLDRFNSHFGKPSGLGRVYVPYVTHP